MKFVQTLLPQIKDGGGKQQLNFQQTETALVCYLQRYMQLKSEGKTGLG